ncbi:MAG: SMP-30/gluconolactonase/LRE family protein [Bradymonadia bacterium]
MTHRSAFMPLRTLPQALGLLPLAMLLGCGEPATEGDGMASEVATRDTESAGTPELVVGGEKADKVGGRILDVATWGVDARMRSASHVGYTSVLEASRVMVQVQTERLVFQPDHDETVIDIRVKPKGALASIRDELLFMVKVRPAGSDEGWTPVYVKEDLERLEHFRRFTFDLGAQTLTLDGKFLPGDRDFKHTLDLPQPFSSDVEFAVEVFPISTWFGLTGHYTYTATVTCDGKPCKGHLQPTEHKDTYALPRVDQHPESCDYDPVGDAMYVGTLNGGGITQIDADGSLWPFSDDEEGMGTLGIRVDAEKGRLWSCAVRTDVDGAYPGVVRVHDIESGELLHTFDLTTAYDDGSCNDLALASSDVAYVTDRENPNVYRVDLSTGDIEIWASDDDLLDSIGVGTNGIAISPDGQKVLITNYLPSRLMVVDVDEPGKVEKVDFDGDWFHEVLGGADGIRFVDNTLYIIFPNHLARVQPRDASWTKGHLSMIDLPEGGHSGLMVVHDDLYMANGQLTTYVTGGTPDAFKVSRFDWASIDR